jgi:putative zinc finger protein
MNWNCEKVEANLSDYVDRLLAPEERREFEAHVHGCARCAPMVAGMMSLVASMHAMEPIELPADLERKILNATLGPRQEKLGWRAWFGWMQPVLQPKFAYGAISLIITTMVISQAVGIEWRKPTLADLNPVNIYRTADRNVHLIYARGSKFFTDLRVVYEIQSRLRPVAPAQAAPEQKQNPGTSNGPDEKSPRKMNRARMQDFETLASALGGLPGRSSR